MDLFYIDPLITNIDDKENNYSFDALIKVLYKDSQKNWRSKSSLEAISRVVNVILEDSFNELFSDLILGKRNKITLFIPIFNSDNYKEIRQYTVVKKLSRTKMVVFEVRARLDQSEFRSLSLPSNYCYDNFRCTEENSLNPVLIVTFTFLKQRIRGDGNVINPSLSPVTVFTKNPTNHFASMLCEMSYSKSKLNCIKKMSKNCIKISNLI